MLVGSFLPLIPRGSSCDFVQPPGSSGEASAFSGAQDLRSMLPLEPPPALTRVPFFRPRYDQTTLRPTFSSMP